MHLSTMCHLFGVLARAAILFFRSPRKTQNLVETLRSCFLSSFVEFRSAVQRRSRKCLSQSEARVAILFFRSARKNTNLVEDVEILLLVKFRLIPFSGFRGEVENVSANQRPGGHLVFPIGPKKQTCRGR